MNVTSKAALSFVQARTLALRDHALAASLAITVEGTSHHTTLTAYSSGLEIEVWPPEGGIEHPSATVDALPESDALRVGEQGHESERHWKSYPESPPSWNPPGGPRRQPRPHGHVCGILICPVKWILTAIALHFIAHDSSIEPVGIGTAEFVRPEANDLTWIKYPLHHDFPVGRRIVLDTESFRALSSETRVQLLKHLDEKRLTLTNLSKKMELAKATVSSHLESLENAGLIRRIDEGRKWIYYSLTAKGKAVLHPESQKVGVILALSIGLSLITETGRQWRLVTTVALP
jgi:DNA-binding transcriptional ArsR family regulator